jgi:glycosyltransferase involved in cell wall biosynthesis
MSFESVKQPEFLIVSPYPADKSYGGGLRLFGLIAALSEVGRVDLLVLECNKYNISHPGTRTVEYVDLNGMGLGGKCIRLLNKLGLFRYGSRAARKKALEMQKTAKYNLVLFSYPRSLEATGRMSDCPHVLDIADIEFIRRLNELKIGGAKRARFRSYVRVLMSYGLFVNIQRRADFSWIVKEGDRRSVMRGKNVQVVPNVAFAYDVAPAYCASSAVAGNEKTILFIAHFGYPPNREGLLWFAEEVWPTIIAANRNVRLVVVGNCPNEQFLNRIKSIERIDYRGYVSSIESVYRDATICINPCRLGSGSQIKVIEAMLFGRVVISTPYGARGWEDAQEECHCPIVAESPEQFAAECLKKLGDDAGRLAMEVGIYRYASQKGTLTYFKNAVQQWYHAFVDKNAALQNSGSVQEAG